MTTNETNSHPAPPGGSTGPDQSVSLPTPPCPSCGRPLEPQKQNNYDYWGPDWAKLPVTDLFWRCSFEEIELEGSALGDSHE